MTTLKIFKYKETAILPTKAHGTDLGYDLYAAENYAIEPNHQIKVSTGIGVGFPKNWGGFIKDRSSMASKGFITSGGVIDEAYTGEISILIRNNNPEDSEPYIIYEGDKIAQLVPIPVTNWAVEEVSSLSETERGNKGFGSSGK